tara:strand:- start:1131 stop:1892 length:762 start_codon:yes stop_codon:yes gene_type:complete
MFGMNRFSSFGNMGMMNSGGGGLLRTALMFMVVLFILYLIINWYFKKHKKILDMSSGTMQHIIPASELPENTKSGSYSYSMWFYVNDWNKRFGQKKVILRKGKENDESIKVSLGETENNIDVTIKCFGTDDNNSQYNSPCVLSNVPLQKWVHMIVSVFGKTLDIYLNGKLYRTCVLPNTPFIDSDGDIIITPDGGFSGWTTNFTYIPNPTNPQQAYNLYKKGYGGSFLGNIFNKYRIKVELLRDNEVAGSFEM